LASEPKTNALAQTRAGYDRWAPIYDCDGNPLQALERPCVRRLLGEVKDRRVLDMGCGTGRHALWLAGEGAQVTAIDFSQGMLDQARTKPGADAVNWLVHDLHNPLPFNDHTFDKVVSGLVLEHIRDLSFFFSQAQRVLKPAGGLVVSAMHPAMFLRGTQARFTDPDSGNVIVPGSLPHPISDFLCAALKANLHLNHISKHQPDETFAKQYPRAEKYIGWPMLVVMGFKA
jgi:ubiquinone/menaquinone biosynthesis C-methylase UbiE